MHGECNTAKDITNENESLHKIAAIAAANTHVASMLHGASANPHHSPSQQGQSPSLGESMLGVAHEMSPHDALYMRANQLDAQAEHMLEMAASARREADELRELAAALPTRPSQGARAAIRRLLSLARGSAAGRYA